MRDDRRVQTLEALDVAIVNWVSQRLTVRAVGSTCN